METLSQFDAHVNNRQSKYAVRDGMELFHTF
jgi:hypothetical protein